MSHRLMKPSELNWNVPATVVPSLSPTSSSMKPRSAALAPVPTAALAVFEKLIDADMAPYDRSLMCHNAGILLEKLGRPKDALRAFDRGIALETTICRSLVAEQKAALLHRLGRNAEALSLYRTL